MRGRGGGIVGRERELAALRAWLEAARGGAGRLVLCAGEPGIGKTRLAQELAGVALAGDTAVAWGRCAPTEGAPAYWPWRQVLRSLGVDPDTVLAGQAESPEDRFRVFDDLTQAVLAVAARRGGLVVVLDDIHWGDEPSLLVLRAGPIGPAPPGFAAEARFHLAATLLARDGPGDRDRARPAARDADRLARALGMAAYRDRAAALVARLGDPGAGGRAGELSPREVEVANLVAEGLTNRQIAERLVISERTAQNHVQHILTKLGFTTRSQIAAWRAQTRE